MIDEMNRIIETIGRAKLCAALGIVDTAISNSIKRAEGFPAHWYAVCKKLCDEVACECPVGAFKMREDQRDHEVVSLLSEDAA